MNGRQAATRRTIPDQRLGTLDLGSLNRKAHHVASLLEIDIEEARSLAREARRTGRGYSLSSWIINEIAKVAARHPEIHAFRRGRRLYSFETVNVALPIERSVKGVRSPLAYLVRDAANKSPAQIDEEIEIAKSKHIDQDGDLVLGGGVSDLSFSLFCRLPQFIRVWLWRTFLLKPRFRHQNMGSIVVTSTLSTRAPGWMLPSTFHPLCIGLGSIARKARVVGDAIVPRDVLHLTAVFDHDVVDGMAAAAFLRELVGCLETPRHPEK